MRKDIIDLAYKNDLVFFTYWDPKREVAIAGLEKRLSDGKDYIVANIVDNEISDDDLLQVLKDNLPAIDRTEGKLKEDK